MTPDEVSRLRADRKKLTATNSALFNEVSAILFEADPIGINFDDNTDEYDAEAGTILPRLKTAHSADEALTIVHEEFVRWFDAEIAGPRDRYTTAAALIWAAYVKSENRPRLRSPR